MDNLEQLIKIDWWQVILAIILFLVCLKFVWSLIDWLLFDKLGIETKKMKQKRQDHELLSATVKDLSELHLKHEEDTKQSIRHDEMIREDLQKLTNIVNNIAEIIQDMQKKDDATEMAKLKEKILGYYRKYAPLGEWESFEANVFWGLYDNYIARGGNSFVKHDIESVMRNLKVID